MASLHGCSTNLLIRKLCAPYILSIRPYFVRFAGLPEASDMAVVQTKRIVQHGPSATDVNEMGAASAFYSSILALQGVDSISEQDRLTAAQVGDMWYKDHPKALVSEAGNRFATQLRDEEWVLNRF